MKLVKPICPVCDHPDRKLTRVRLGIGRRYGTVEVCSRCVAVLTPFIDQITVPEPVRAVVSDPADVIARRRLRR